MAVNRIVGDLFRYFYTTPDCVAAVVTVNCTRRRPDGSKQRIAGPMGAGIALQAAQMYPAFQQAWSTFLTKTEPPPSGGYDPPLAWEIPSLPVAGKHLIAMPTKGDFWRPSDVGKLADSLDKLRLLVDVYDWRHVALPLVGAGLGRVKPATIWKMLDARLDERFTVCVRET